jgi:hypothetical protein
MPSSAVITAQSCVSHQVFGCSQPPALVQREASPNDLDDLLSLLVHATVPHHWPLVGIATTRCGIQGSCCQYRMTVPQVSLAFSAGDYREMVPTEKQKEATKEELSPVKVLPALVHHTHYLGPTYKTCTYQLPNRIEWSIRTAVQKCLESWSKGFSNHAKPRPAFPPSRAAGYDAIPVPLPTDSQPGLRGTYARVLLLLRPRAAGVGEGCGTQVRHDRLYVHIEQDL